MGNLSMSRVERYSKTDIANIMSRLASLSTPTRRQSPSPSPSPAPTDLGVGVVETTHHRMLKLVITEFKSLFRTWDDLVGVDGLKAGQGIINAQTTME
jgi:hypothetical protein